MPAHSHAAHFHTAKAEGRAFKASEFPGFHSATLSVSGASVD